MTKVERNAEIYRLYLEGQSLQDLGQRFSISHERIRQLLRKASIFKVDRYKEALNRDQFLGVNLTEPVKEALRQEAQRRGLSISALSSETLREMLTACGALDAK